MKKCGNCGKEYADQFKFCPYCGTKKPAVQEFVRCAGCGFEFISNYTFCPNCGKPVAAAGAGAAPIPKINHCASCNAVITKGMRFCSVCGAQVGSAANPVETAAQNMNQSTPVDGPADSGTPVGGLDEAFQSVFGPGSAASSGTADSGAILLQVKNASLLLREVKNAKDVIDSMSGNYLFFDDHLVFQQTASKKRDVIGSGFGILGTIIAQKTLKPQQITISYSDLVNCEIVPYPVGKNNRMVRAVRTNGTMITIFSMPVPVIVTVAGILNNHMRQ